MLRDGKVTRVSHAVFEFLRRTRSASSRPRWQGAGSCAPCHSSASCALSFMRRGSKQVSGPPPASASRAYLHEHPLVVRYERQDLATRATTQLLRTLQKTRRAARSTSTTASAWSGAGSCRRLSSSYTSTPRVTASASHDIATARRSGALLACCPHGPCSIWHQTCGK